MLLPYLCFACVRPPVYLSSIRVGAVVWCGILLATPSYAAGCEFGGDAPLRRFLYGSYACHGNGLRYQSP